MKHKTAKKVPNTPQNRYLAAVTAVNKARKALTAAEAETAEAYSEYQLRLSESQEAERDLRAAQTVEQQARREFVG